MFDIGFWEMAMIGIVALVIIGPERLPKVARTVGLWTGKARRMMRDVKADIKREMKEQDIADLTELKKDFQSAGEEIKGATGNIKESVGAEDLTKSLKESFAEVSPLGKDGLLQTDSESSTDVSTGKAGKSEETRLASAAKSSSPEKTTPDKAASNTSGRKKPVGPGKAASTAGKKTSSKKTSSKKISRKKANRTDTAGTADKKKAAKKPVKKKVTKYKVAKSKAAGRNPGSDKSTDQSAETA